MTKKVVLDDLLISYTMQGSGKTVLLLHGWGDNKETFTNLMNELSVHYQAVSLDLPGFGASQAPSKSWDLTDYATFVGDVCKKLKFQPYAVIGHSNGGALALHAVAHQKLKTQKLVLLAASGVRSSSGMRRTMLMIVSKVGRLLTFWLPKKTKVTLRKLLYGTVGSDMLVAPHMEETFKRVVRQDIQQDAKMIETTTLLMYGDHDNATPVKAVGKTLQKLIPNSRLVTLGGDHFIHHSAARQVSKEIMEFLA